MRKTIYILIIMTLAFQVKAQISHSVYFMNHIPPSSLVNPALTGEAKFYVNVPVLSIYNSFVSPLAYNDLTTPFPSGDSVYIDRDKIVGVLGEKNHFAFDNYTELLKAGIKVGKSNISLSLNQVLSARLDFDQDLARLALFGNGHEDLIGTTTAIEKTGIRVNLYHEFALGYALEVSELFTVGFRAKYLNGFMNFSTDKLALTLRTDPNTNYALTVSSDIELNTSNDFDKFNDFKWYDYGQNHGYAFDFGLYMKPSERMHIGFSVVDIGRINWQKNVTNYRSVNPGEEYTFNGFDFNSWYVDDTVNSSIQILDSIQEHFQLEKNHDSYISTLTPKIYLGGQFYLTPKDDIGVLMKSEVMNSRLHPSFTFNYKHRFGNILAVQANYSIINNTFDNFGLGASIKAGPVMVYAITDRALGIFKPAESMTYNLLVGVTLVFGNRNKNKEIETEE